MSHPGNSGIPRRAERPAGGDTDQSTAQQAQQTAAQAKDAAADVAGHGQQAAADVAKTGQQAVGQVAGEAKKQASDLLSKTRAEVREQVETGRTSVVASLRDLEDQLAAMTDDVDQEGTAIEAAATARDRVRGAADWLEARDQDQILEQVRRVGRQRPGMFLLAAGLAGVVAGRLTRGVVATHTNDSDTDNSDKPRLRVQNVSSSQQHGTHAGTGGGVGRE
ncbi:MAG: hypothetical protein M3Y49_11685 [Actinomycetota bacterium]|nr:hypothetical protein [Actinomycetota bacterium]